MKTENLINWEVVEKRIKLDTGEPIYNGKALVRSDTNEVLEVVSSNYVPFKNKDLTKLVQNISDREKINESNIEVIETRDGQKLSIILNLDLNLSVRDDVVSNQLLVQNSHGGFSSLKFGFGNVVFSCSNGMVIFDSVRDYKFFHNKYSRRSVDELVKNIDWIKDDIIRFNEFSNRIADVVIDDRKKITIDAINYVTNVDLSISKEAYIKRFSGIMDVYKLDFKWDAAVRMSESISLEMDNKGNNYWGLLNGFTYYNSHKSSVSDRKAFLVDGYGKVISDKATRFIKEQLKMN